MTLGKTQRRTLDFLRTNPQQWETTQLAKQLNLSDDQCLSALRRLHKRGLVMRTQRGKEFIWTVTPDQLLN